MYLFIFNCAGSSLLHTDFPELRRASFLLWWFLSLRSLGSSGVQSTGSVVVIYGLSSPAACGILVPRPGIALCLLHWQADS